MKTKVMLFLMSFMLVLTSCTKNQRAKSWGGTTSVNLQPGERLVNATWKRSQLWYLTRPMRKDEAPETSVFREQSNFGMLQGTVKFIESK